MILIENLINILNRVDCSIFGIVGLPEQTFNKFLNFFTNQSNHIEQSFFHLSVTKT